MNYFLLIETATSVCSVAIVDSSGVVVSQRESCEQGSHSSKLSVFINEIIAESGITYRHLSAVSISSGPGSYTGLRIGTAAAKGICYALEIPLIAINTLQSMAYGAKKQYGKFEGLFCPMIDARRMEVYTAFFTEKADEIRATQADIITQGIYNDYLDKQNVLFFGDGASKTKELLSIHNNAVFFDEFKMTASSLVEPTLEKYLQQEFEDSAYFEPFYLKDFVAGKPRVKGLY